MVKIPDPTETADRYLVTAPCLDAYTSGATITFEAFSHMLTSFANDWGARAIGWQVRMNNQYAIAMADLGVYPILSIGRFGSRKFAVVSKGDLETEIVEYDWPDDLDMT